MAMGGQAEAIAGVLKQRPPARHAALAEALALAVEALGSVGGEGGAPRSSAPSQLEVAVLDRRRKGRAFRRITGAALTALLERPPPRRAGRTPRPRTRGAGRRARTSPAEGRPHSARTGDGTGQADGYRLTPGRERGNAGDRQASGAQGKTEPSSTVLESSQAG